MTPLDALKATLEAKRAVADTMREAYPGIDTVTILLSIENSNKRMALDALLTDDTIAALIAVAEAVGEIREILVALPPEVIEAFIDADIAPGSMVDSIDAALAPLVKEDCPTCHGLGSGGGFDRNGSHTEGRYCEYPCPNCGKEV